MTRPESAALAAVGVVAAAGAFAILAWLFPAVIHGSAGAGWWALPLAGAVAAPLAAVPLWWLLVLRPARLAPAGRRRVALRGLVAGLLAGVLAHPLTWYLLALGAFVTGERGSLGDPVVNPLQAVPLSLVLSVFSLFTLGWVTIPAGALAGVSLALLLRGRTRT